jgi:PAS domain S-box-containing protein
MNTARQLQKYGYSVLTALNGEQALQQLNQEPHIDVVLMDIDLGQNQPDGTEVARQILSQRSIPVIFLSGHSEPEILAKTEAITSYGYVLKDSGEHVLTATIKMAYQLYQTHCLLNEREASLQKVLADQRSAAEALQQKSAELEMFFENAYGLLCFADVNGYFRRVNQEWTRVLGFTMEELTGQRFLDFVHPDDLPATLAVLNDLAGQKPALNFVNRYRCHDGSYRWIEWRSKPYGDLLLATASDITERVQTEQKMKKQQKLLNEMGALARVGGWEIDLESRTLSWTDEVYRMHEVDADFVPDLSQAKDFYAPHHREIISEAVQRAIETGAPFDLELQLVTAKGNWLWVQAVGRSVMENKRIRSVEGTVQDITSRKQFELTQNFLARSSSQGRQFFQDLAVYLAEHLRIDYVCIDRLEPGSLAAQTVAVYSDGKIEDNYRYTLQDTPCGVLAGQQVCCFPNNVRHLFPGDLMLSEFGAESYAGVTLFDSKAQPSGLIAVIGRSPLANPMQVEAVLQLVAVRAASELERAQAEEALHASEERYRALIEISPDPISITDLEGKFISVNHAGLQELGYHSMEELRSSGLTSFDFIVKADQERALQNLRKTAEQGAVRNIEYRLRRRDGSVIWTELSAALLRDGAGQPVAFIGITHDIGERKRALDEKSTLLSDLQHRIKNSLALITSLISLEQNNAQQPETQKSLNEIYDRVSSLAKLYNILYESHDMQQVDLAQYLTQVVQSLSSSYLRSGVELEVNLDSVLIDVRMATPFGLILNELLTNALKYAFPAGRKGKIWIGLKRTGEELALEVCDNGVGLPAATEKGYVQGLGLQLVDLLVNQLHGCLKSSNGELTSFIIEVPYQEVC